MSLDNFFQSAATGKTRRMTRRDNANASIASASKDGQDVAEDAETEPGTVSDFEDNAIVVRVTKNIEEMLNKQVATILKPVTELSGKFDIMAQRMANVEQRVSDLEDLSAESAPRLEAMEKTLKRTLERLDNFENQSRRQNIKITGLKMGIEGRSPVTFFEEWIPRILDMEQTRVKIERAHRVGPPTGRDGSDYPRAVLVRLHDYTDKLKILNAARNKGDIKVEDRKVFFYQDFSAEVVRKRQESASARRQLREAGIRYAFAYPAVIKIFNKNGTTTSLSSMKEINNFLQSLK